MTGIRRWYIYLVSLVSLQALAWAVISLLQNLLVYGRRADVAFDTDSLSWQIALIVVTLPVFLAHWLWAQRLVYKEVEEQTSWVRGLYLYGVMSSFLIPILFNGYELLQYLLQLVFKVEPRNFYSQLTPANVALAQLLSIVVLVPLWFYHYRLTESELSSVSFPKSVQRWYVFGFAAAGLIMTAVGTATLLIWILEQFEGNTTVGSTTTLLAAELARLCVGVPLWLFFWRQAQQQFAQGDKAEQHSTVRKIYLYAFIFVTALTAVAATTGIFAGILRYFLGLPAQGDIRETVAIIVVAAALWFYHARVLHQDIQASEEQPKQATIRRLYWYLIASIGLAAFLVGFGGDISVLIRSFSTAFVTEQRDQLAWFTAALVAGLPVWLWPWRQAQFAAAAPGEASRYERDAIVRKIYLYFYIFVATMTALASAVYIVYRLVSVILGVNTAVNLGAELAHAIAYIIMAVAVWLYHGAVLRSDTRLTAAPAMPDSLQVVVLDQQDGNLGRPLLAALHQALPFATLQTVAFPGDTQNGHEPETALAEAELIITPWPMGQSQAVYATAVAHSPARKLLIPVRQKGWEWVGVEPWSLENIISETVEASRQIAVGGVVVQSPHSIASIASIIGGVLALLIIMFTLISAFFTYLFF
jgi:hypothetical protein